MSAGQPVRARAMRFGRLLASLESARTAIELASRDVDLLSALDRDLLVDAGVTLAGLVQRAYEVKP